MFGWKCPPWGRAVQFSGALALLIVSFAGSASGVLADDTPIGSSEVSALGVSNPDPACLDSLEQVPPQDSLEDPCELAIGEPNPVTGTSTDQQGALKTLEDHLQGSSNQESGDATQSEDGGEDPTNPVALPRTIGQSRNSER